VEGKVENKKHKHCGVEREGAAGENKEEELVFCCCCCCCK